MSEKPGHPPEIADDVRRTVRLEWWNVGWTISVILVMGITMGGSQAMKTAWVEDTLGLVPPIAFLIAIRWEARCADDRFQYGYDRANGLGFLIAAVALAAVGVLLLKDAATSLLAAEHVTIGSVRVLGGEMWLGWFMLAAQAYSIIPPLIVGHKELPLAKRLRDKLIHTDALMNKANWQTGVAGIVGVAGLGMGWWWADSAAAAFISLSIIWDGYGALKVATAELLDGVPRELDGSGCSPEADRIADALRKAFPDGRILMRETGRYIRAEVVGVKPPEDFDFDRFDIPDLDWRWRLDSIAFRP